MNKAAWKHWRSLLVLVGLLVLAAPAELAARGGFRGGGGGGGGGFRGAGAGAGRGAGGGFSRGGAARSGSIGGYDRSRSGGYRGSSPGDSRAPGGSQTRNGSFENRRGETVDWNSNVSKGDDGWTREGSWESSSGASGSGSREVNVENGRVESVDRSRQVENAQGETMNREVSSKRDGDQIEREGSVQTSTGVKADTSSTLEKTDDGFIAQGSIDGKDGAAAGTIVKDGNDVYMRGAATDGDDLKYGRAHCSGGVCTGGTVKVDVDDYYRDPYYYYPYYYGWYSCPYGSVQTWHSRYGTPIYGCSNVHVIHTTIALGPSGSANAAGSGSSREAQVTSAPVLMYEVGSEGEGATVVYATSYRPKDVYAEKQGTRFFWAPGPEQAAPDVKKWIAEAGAMRSPSANATVITYTIGDRIVYLTNERPAPGFFAEPAAQLFAWIPGVRQPSPEEKDAIRTAITAQQAGGQAALDREARKLEKNRDPPPATPEA